MREAGIISRKMKYSNVLNDLGDYLKTESRLKKTTEIWSMAVDNIAS